MGGQDLYLLWLKFQTLCAEGDGGAGVGMVPGGPLQLLPAATKCRVLPEAGSCSAKLTL